MKKIILLSILSVCIFTVNAQQNINVSISTKVIDNDVYVLTTITNANDEFVVISATGISDPSGFVADGSNSFIILNAYNTNGTLTGIPNKVFIPRNLDDTKIKLLKGESYKKLDRLYSFDGYYGYYSKRFGSELSQIQAKVHLRYLLHHTNGGTIYETDILSNKITF